ncbi:MAG: DoxX family membrane protein [Halopseudomonas aestusnigri]
MIMKKITLSNILYFFCLIIFLSVLYAPNTSAHVKWFVDTETASVENFQAYHLFDLPVLVWIGVMVVAILLSIILDMKLPVIRIADSKTRHDFIEIMRIFTGMSLLLTAYEGALLAPHLLAHGPVGIVMVFLQAVIGIMLIGNRFIKYAALMMFTLFLGVIIQFGFLSALEYSNVFGIGLFLLFNHLSGSDLSERIKTYSVDTLRIFTGISLATLGVTEKLTGAVYGQTFLADYQWNFMQLLGFDLFDDRLLVLSAGMSEVILGLVLILGTTTRLTMLAISGLMLTSNIVFIVQGNNDAALKEFVGHLPIIGSALVLILLGYGQRFKITNLWKSIPTKST